MKKLLFVIMVMSQMACNSYDDPFADGVDTNNDTSSNTNTDGNGNNNPDEPDYNLLFIGNSLTYYNSLPRLVEEEAFNKGIVVASESIAFGNYGLEDHWNDGEIQLFIATQKYDFVIIQQGPSSQAYGRESLIEYGGKIAEVCEENGTELAFYMVWPSLSYYHTFDGVIQNYTDAAAMSNAILCPVGSVWRQHFDATNDFSYYGADGFHPSMEGSLVAAKVIVESLGLE